MSVKARCDWIGAYPLRQLPDVKAIKPQATLTGETGERLIEATVETLGEPVRRLNSLAALGPHDRRDADRRKIGDENVGRALVGQIGHDAPHGGNGGIHHRKGLRLAHSRQQIVASPIDDVKDTSMGAGPSQIGARLRPQAGGAGAGIKTSPTNRKVGSARPARLEHEAEPGGQMLNPDRSVRGAPRVAVVRQAVSEDHDLIEGW